MSEKISGYTLTVQASDNGSPPRVNTTTVNIDVSDVNDNAPVFSKGNYSVIIQVILGGGGAQGFIEHIPFEMSSSIDFSCSFEIPFFSKDCFLEKWKEQTESINTKR